MTFNPGEQKCFIVFSGSNDRAVLAFLRALDRCGERAAIIARTSADLMLKTRFRRNVVLVRGNQVLNLDVFRNGLTAAQAATGKRSFVALPSSEFFNRFLLQNRGEIEAMGCEIPLVDESLYETLTGKRSATKLFGNMGQSMPRELDPDSHLQAPIVAKPKVNITPQGQSLYPRLLLRQQDLQEFLRDSIRSEYFLQEFVEGESTYLLFYLPKDGSKPVSWSQRNLLQQPNGKSMLLAESSDFHLSSTAKQLLEILHSTGFHGLGMLEVILTPSRKVFIEMNPRIWGPVQLCMDCGQPLLEAFIGDALFDDPLRFIDRGHPSHRRYFWFGGLVSTLANGEQPVWHTARRSVLKTTLANLRHDIYLRGDSWRCFFAELLSPLKIG